MTSSTGDVLWRQDPDSPQLEVTTTLILPHGASPRDLTVAVTNEGQLLTVKYKEAVLLSWQLWRPVKVGSGEDLQWLMEGGKICIELVKAEKEPWSQLVGWTLPLSDVAFVDIAALDAMYAAEVPPLPAAKVVKAKKTKKVAATAPAPETETTSEVTSTAAAATESETEESSAKASSCEKVEASEGETLAASPAAEEEEKAVEAKDEVTSTAVEVDGEDADLDALLDEVVEEVKQDAAKEEEEVEESTSAVAADGDEAAKEETESATSESEAEEEAINLDDDEDLDNMLNEIDAEEHPVVRLELKGLEDEQAEISKKTKDYTAQVTSGLNEKGEELEEAEKAELARRLDVLHKLATFNRNMREVRSRPSTIANFFEHQRIEIAKGRCNSGDLDESEVELFADESERNMTGDELLAKGMESLQIKTKEAFFEGLRLLRLAALHKNSAQASVILFNLYTEMNEHAKGCFFVVRRAQMDDCEPMTNSLAGSLHDEGVRLFPPWLGLSIYYHQRAAASGSASSMLQLANLWQRGCTNGAKQLLSNPQHAKLALTNSDAQKFLRWVNHAEARASGSAFFAKCQLHMTGDLDECEQSYIKASKYWKRALAAMPEFKQLAPRVEPQLEALKQKLNQGSPTDSKAPTLGNTAPTSSALVSAGAPRASAGGAMSKKLGALEARSGNAHAMMDRSGPQGGDGGKAQARGASSKKFWERTVTTGVAVFSIYTLCFPLRVMLLPQFYTVVEILKGMVLGSLLGAGGQRGGFRGPGGF